MNNFNRIEQAFTISLLAYDGKFSYSKGCMPFTGISSYQLKRFLDKQWDENQKLEEYIKSLDIDWSKGWLEVDDTIIEKPYAEEGNLKGVGHKVNITKYCKRYYATNATGKRITSKFIVKNYRVRWDIEVLFRSLKQLCHLQDCQSKKTSTQRHYVFMCLQAFITLQDQNQKSVYQAKKYFQQKNLRIKVNGNKVLRQMTA